MVVRFVDTEGRKRATSRTVPEGQCDDETTSLCKRMKGQAIHVSDVSPMKGEVQDVPDIKEESDADNGDDDAADNEPQVNAAGGASSSVVAPSTAPVALNSAWDHIFKGRS